MHLDTILSHYQQPLPHAEGLHPTVDKVQAIKEAPTPQTLSELRSFLGIISYYHNFLLNLSCRLHPLYALLSSRAPWIWGEAQQQAFKSAKDALQHNSLLIHYDETKPLVLSCDASPCSLGAVLSHKIKNAP